MAITYDSGTNKITITDEASVDCQSICDNCTQVTKAGTLQFFSTARWHFINSHFKDTNKQIHFNCSSGYIYADTNSSFQLGEIDGNGNVSDGCAMKFDTCQLDFWSSSGSAGTVKLYDSFLDVPGAFFRCYSGTSQIFEIIGCIVQGGSGGRIQGATSKLKNLYLHNFTNYAYGSKGAGVTFDNITITDSQYAMYYSPVYGGSANCTVTGLKGRNNTTGFRLTNGSQGDLYMANPDLDAWTFMWSGFPNRVFRQYSFNLKAVDVNGDEVGGASVTIRDKNNNVVSYVDSDANLNEPLTTTETGVDVTDGTKFDVDDIIRIYSEYMKVTGISGNTLTVERNTYGSGYFATGHLTGADIFKVGSLQTVESGGDEGKITEQIISYGYYNQTNDTVMQNYGPHTLEIKHYKYLPYLSKMEINAVINYVLTLTEDPYITKTEAEAATIDGGCTP